MTSRKGYAALAGTVIALAVPAVAPAALYEGGGTTDNAVDVKLRTGTKDGKRVVKRVVVEKLRFVNGERLCEASGRTEELRLTGNFKIRADGTFRAIGNPPVANPAEDGGELIVRGDVGRRKATGDARFTFGKTGCRTERAAWKATR